MDGNVREQIDDAVFEAAAGLAAAVIRAAHEELHRAARQAGLRLRLPRSPASGANLLLENQTSKEISESIVFRGLAIGSTMALVSLR
jgi:hypothetical protein